MSNGELKVDTDLITTQASQVLEAHAELRKAQQEFDGPEAENLRPGQFPEADQLRERAVELLEVYRAHAEQLGLATQQLEVGLQEAVLGYEAAEDANARRADSGPQTSDGPLSA